MADACTNISATIPALLSAFAAQPQNARLAGLDEETLKGVVGLVSVSAEPFINAFAHAGVEIGEGVFRKAGLDLGSDGANGEGLARRSNGNSNTTMTSLPVYPDPYPGSNTALYAHSSQHPTTPASLLVAYSLPDAIQASEESVRALQEGVFKGLIAKVTSAVVKVAVEEGESVGGVVPGGLSVSVSTNGGASGSGGVDKVPPLLYPNYAFEDTPLEAMYGPTNVRRMRRLVRIVDPKGVMKLTGGFLFQ